jgi:hypothetical protein
MLTEAHDIDMICGINIMVNININNVNMGEMDEIQMGAPPSSRRKAPPWTVSVAAGGGQSLFTTTAWRSFTRPELRYLLQRSHVYVLWLHSVPPRHVCQYVNRKELARAAS